MNMLAVFNSTLPKHASEFRPQISDDSANFNVFLHKAGNSNQVEVKKHISVALIEDKDGNFPPNEPAVDDVVLSLEEQIQLGTMDLDKGQENINGEIEASIPNDLVQKFTSTYEKFVANDSKNNQVENNAFVIPTVIDKSTTSLTNNKEMQYEINEAIESTEDLQNIDEINMEIYRWLQVNNLNQLDDITMKAIFANVADLLVGSEELLDNASISVSGKGKELNEGLLTLLSNLKSIFENRQVNLETDKEIVIKHQILDLLQKSPANAVDKKQTRNFKVGEMIELKLADEAKLQQLFEKIQEQLSKLDSASSRRLSSEVLTLLREWTQWMTKLENEAMMKLFTEKFDDKTKTIWQQLTAVFAKRNYFTGTNYQSNAHVTKQDVANWLEQAVARYDYTNSVQENVSVEQVNVVAATEHNIPMSKVEQFTIHLQQTDRVERVAEQLMEKFSQVIKQSRFLTSNSLQQLSLNIRPDNLGNMLIKLEQVNGEMRVNIMVATQAAKQLLETNMHQLKHLFAPHQIIIERNDNLIDDELLGHQDEADEQMMEEQDESKEKNQEDEKQDSNDDFKNLFNQLKEGGLLDVEN